MEVVIMKVLRFLKVLIIALGFGLVLFLMLQSFSDTYERDATVVDVKYESVVFRDSDGHKFEYRTLKSDDFSIGDTVTLTLDFNYSYDNPNDDTVVSVKRR